MAYIIFGPDGKTISRDISAQYTGEKTGGELRGWNTFTADPNAFLLSSYKLLCQRNATLYHTSAVARACVNKPITYEIGDGLVFRSAIDAEFLGISETEAKDWSREFTELLHYEKLESNYYEKQKLILREAKITGDSILYFLREGIDGIPFDLVPAGGYAIDESKSDQGYTLGIKMDEYSRRTGFRQRQSGKHIDFRDENGYQNAIQFMFKERAGQARGYGSFYSEIARAKNLDRVWDATIERMFQESIQLGYFNTSFSDPKKQAAEMARQSAGRSKASDSVRPLTGSTEMRTGGMYMFENSESMQFTDLKTPSNNFGLANEWAVKMFGMATGWSPGFIMTEYSTSYTSHKGAFNDDLKHIMQDRATFIRLVDTVVNLEYLKHFILSGQLRVSEAFWSDYRIRRAYLEGTVLGPVPGHINPMQEINADIKANEAGALTKSQMSAKYGNDFWKMLSEWQSQQEAWSEASPAKRAEAFAADVEARQDNQDQDNSVPSGSQDRETDTNDGPEAKKRPWSIFSRRRKK